jgi:hypothetical protein
MQQKCSELQHVAEPTAGDEPSERRSGHRLIRARFSVYRSTGGGGGVKPRRDKQTSIRRESKALDRRLHLWRLQQTNQPAQAHASAGYAVESLRTHQPFSFHFSVRDVKQPIHITAYFALSASAGIYHLQSVDRAIAHTRLSALGPRRRFPPLPLCHSPYPQ